MNEDLNYGEDPELQGDEDFATPLQGAGQDTTRWLLDTNYQIDRYMHFLRGEEYVDEKWQPIQGMIPVMNQKGVMAVTSYTRQYASKIMFLSDIDKAEVYEITLNFVNVLTQLIFNNGEEYEIDWNSSMQNVIVDLAGDIVLMSLSRAINHGEKTFLGSHTKILHRIDESQRPSQDKEKKFGIF
jgi:hypothetical protein